MSRGLEDRIFSGFFALASQMLCPGAVVIEHLSRDEWQHGGITDMLARGYSEAGKTRSNTFVRRDRVFASGP